MESPPPEPEYRNETALKGNGGFTVIIEMLYEKILTMASRVISEQVVLAPVRHPPEVIQFPLQIDVPLPLPPPIMPSSPLNFPPLLRT